MANIFPRLFPNNFLKILRISECRCSLPRVFSTTRSNTSRRYDFLHRKEQLFSCTVRNKPALWQIRAYADETQKEGAVKNNGNTKPTIFQRFKSMYKDYWYVLIPVHVVTSIGWFGGFYYMARSGVDIIGMLEAMNVSEKIIHSMKDSKMGYLAIAYACYKIATPARYTVTLGGTTISINYLKKWGYIKPVPSAERLKEMYKAKKDNFDRTMREKKEEIRARKDVLIAKKEELKNKIDDRLEQGIHKIEELKDKTDKIKQKAEDMLKDKK